MLGTLLATFRVGPVAPLRLAGTMYVEAVRNVPLTVLFTLFYFGLPKAGIGYPRFLSAVIVLSAYTGAFVGETLRAGINAVSAGQAEAARALGLRFSQVLGHVVLPQAYRTVVAPLGTLFIALVKNSAVATVISVGELTHLARQLATTSAQPVPVFLGAMVGYLLLTLPSGTLIGAIERRVAIKR